MFSLFLAVVKAGMIPPQKQLASAFDFGGRRGEIAEKFVDAVFGFSGLGFEDILHYALQLLRITEHDNIRVQIGYLIVDPITGRMYYLDEDVYINMTPMPQK